MKDGSIKISKFLSLVLRHQPETIGRLRTKRATKILYHGTTEGFLPSIREQGLLRGKRHDVHLSEQRETATAVGSRYGWPIVLKIASERMNKDGHLFFRSANGVWLTDHVPMDYIEFPDEDT